VVTHVAKQAEWVFLVHRLPRTPSAPRIALWRALRRLGAGLLTDGLVALPADPRTVEHFEWLASGIRENGGDSSVWVARPSTRQSSEQLASQIRDAAEEEYRSVIREATGGGGDKRRLQRRLRRQLRAIGARDYFAAPSSDRARRAVEDLAREEVPA
jgi:hypothetical protein